MSDEDAGSHRGHTGAILSPLAAIRHGVGPLTSRGELPAGSEFDHFRDVLEHRRQEALAWVGGDQANVFDRDAVESYARWSTAHDVLWGVLMAEGLLTKTRRRKSMIEMAERIDKRAVYHAEQCRGRRAVKDVSRMSVQEWLAQQRPVERG
jgi:hypothetical protein